jgi:potassium channel subfamily K
MRHVLKLSVRLVTVNALSLVLGVLANLSILLAVRDGSGWLAKYDLQLTIATVVGGLTASVILIALVITASAELDLPSTPSLSFTEAFYYAIISAVLYFITSSFIIYTAYMLWKLSKYERSEVQFAKGYRRLMLLTVLFMAYILLGAIVFSHIEGWNYLDAVYWADVTILTIGFGNFQPSTNLGRALLLPYAACGIFILFLIIYCIPKLVFDRGGSMWEIHLRDQERIRKVQEREEQERAQNATFQSHLPNGNAPKEDKKPAQDMDAAQATGALDEAKEKHREARKRDFMLMQDILKRTTRKRLLYSIILWASWLIILWLVGAACFYSFERAFGWTYFDAIYFTFTAILAIGYGDITLSSDSGKAFFVIWSLIVVPTLTMSIIAMVEAVGHPYVVSRKIRLKEMSGKISSSEEKRSITGQFPSSQPLDISRTDR